MIKSCYIHIPFCNSICSYCGFCKMFYNKDMVTKYLDCLSKEINEIYKGEQLNTIYIGGGTPSSLRIDELKQLLNILSKLNKSKELEYTIEINFDSITTEKLDLFKRFGINRLSFGLESIDKTNLKYLDRTVNIDHVKDIINYAKSIGINNINIDLMYALKNETVDILNKDIDFILSLGIPHVSTYSLMIEEHTKLYIAKEVEIDEDLDYDMYQIIKKRLTSRGFINYEISNYALDGYQSRHNLVYWNNLEYYGFGLGASSYIGKERINNTWSFNNYIDGNYRKEIEILNKYDIMSYEMILGLRKTKGVSKKEFRRKYNLDISDVFNYQYLISKGLLGEDEEYLYIPEDKLYISNSILTEFVGGS